MNKIVLSNSLSDFNNKWLIYGNEISFEKYTAEIEISTCSVKDDNITLSAYIEELELSHIQDEILTINNNVGTINIKGVLIKDFGYLPYYYPSNFTAYSSIKKAFNQLENDNNITKIVLLINSQGGSVNGIDDVTTVIRQGKKEVYTYIEDMGASAGYWIASLGKKIYANKLAMVGSIGVITKFERYTGNDYKTFIFRSTQSPNKAKDPVTEGSEELQIELDAICDIFIEDVAKNRNITQDDVINNYGKGSVFIGNKALENGLIDSVIDKKAFYDIILDIENNNGSSEVNRPKNKDNDVNATAQTNNIKDTDKVEKNKDDIDATMDLLDDVAKATTNDNFMAVKDLIVANKELFAMNKTEAKKLLTDANLQATKDFIAKNVIDNDLKVTAGAITDNPKDENKNEDYQNDLSATVADFIKDME